MTAGVDWATTDHAVAVVDATGTAIDRYTVRALAVGLRELVRRLRRSNVAEVAIERSDGQVVDTLLAAGFTVVVSAPGQVANLRGRYRAAGNKDDRFDVLADTLRTDRARLQPLIPDTPAMVALRSAVRARKDLLTHRVGLANQLRAHLESHYPGPVGLFADLDSPTSLRFLTRFGCQDDADWLTRSRLATWLRQVGTLLDAHVDAPIFRSLPRCQTLRAARLLAEIGDCRARFPTPDALASLAGGSPPRPASPARSKSPHSGGPPTNTCVTRSATSPPTPATPTLGPLTATTRPSPAGTATPTPSGSSPAPGCT